MTSRRALAAASLLSLLSVVATARPAFADERAVCASTSEKAQQLKNAGKLGEAREQLAQCSRAECPKLIQQDCTQWMSEVLAALPSVVPAAKDRNGRDVVDVRVSVDGKVMAQTLDGKAIVLDPGVHAFHFETKGAPAVDEQVVVKPGEKNRIVTATFALNDDGSAAGGARSSGGTPPAEPSPSSPPIAAFVVGGLGVLTLGAAGYFGLSGNSDARDLRDGCAPKCAQADVDDVEQKYTIARVAAGVGGALLITGVVLFILHPRGSSRVGTSSQFPTAVIRF